MADAPNTDLEPALSPDGIRCQFQAPGQLVVSTQVGPVWPDRGNSFWVTRVAGPWHLFTWAPVGYRLADPARVAELCRALMACGTKAVGVVPAGVAVEFGPTELSDAAAEAVWRAVDA